MRHCSSFCFTTDQKKEETKSKVILPIGTKTLLVVPTQYPTTTSSKNRSFHTYFVAKLEPVLKIEKKITQTLSNQINLAHFKICWKERKNYGKIYSLEAHNAVSRPRMQFFLVNLSVLISFACSQTPLLLWFLCKKSSTGRLLMFSISGSFSRLISCVLDMCFR